MLLLALSGCFPNAQGTPDDTGTTCNEANESCGPNNCSGEGAEMLPGSDCLACHTSGSAARQRQASAQEEDELGGAFTAAGTVFSDIDGSSPAAGVTVRLVDANASEVVLTTNAAGNFYTAEPLAFPISVEVDLNGNTVAMQSTEQTGACNSCHQGGGAAGGKLYAP